MSPLQRSAAALPMQGARFHCSNRPTDCLKHFWGRIAARFATKEHLWTDELNLLLQNSWQSDSLTSGRFSGIK